MYVLYANDETLRASFGSTIGESATFENMPVAEEPEPEVPLDLQKDQAR